MTWLPCGALSSVAPSTFTLAVGVIEIAAGLLVAFKPRMHCPLAWRVTVHSALGEQDAKRGAQITMPSGDVYTCDFELHPDLRATSDIEEIVTVTAVDTTNSRFRAVFTAASCGSFQ